MLSLSPVERLPEPAGLPYRCPVSARITLVLPYFNEAGYIGRTLASLGCQSDRRFELVLVDNGSTDDTTAVARAIAAEALRDIEVRWRVEPRPGKIFALRAGLELVATEFVATIDADTIYPDDYVARTIAMFDADLGAVAVLAVRGHRDRAAWFPLVQTVLFPGKCLTGGYGQAFRTQDLKAAGGFDPATWPYVLEDHEIMARIGQRGRLLYATDHSCEPSNRRKDRASVDWTLLERVLYKLMPPRWLPWFFHAFLAPRFARRGLANVNLRAKSWLPEQSQP